MNKHNMRFSFGRKTIGLLCSFFFLSYTLAQDTTSSPQQFHLEYAHEWRDNPLKANERLMYTRPLVNGIPQRPWKLSVCNAQKSCPREFTSK